MKLSAIFPLVLLGVSVPAMGQVVLSPYWTDGAVIQRGKPITVEGRAGPGENVAGKLGDERQSVVAGQDGRFALQFSAREAGGEALTLIVGDRSAVDLVVGDVWLCSGQSNMEFAVRQGLNAGTEIASSADDGLRLLQVPKGANASPQAAFSNDAAWAGASPQTVPTFSAACYFMGRDLRKALGVPIGLINASFGGSQARVWLPPEAGKALYGAEQMEMLHSFTDDPLGAVTRFAPMWEADYREQSGGSAPWQASDSLEWSPVPKISLWNEWDGSPLAEHPVGTVWLRRSIDLSPGQASAGAVLSLGVVDEIDMTWVNGHPIGNTFGWDVEREYHVPARLLKPGRNEILVAATNTWGSGGLSSPAQKLAFKPAGGAPIPLADGWSYSVAPIKNLPPRSPWDANAGIGVRHNAMVAPLGHVALKGAAWYQGESDVDLPGYRDRMRELMAGWRSQFSPDMRMLIVQLANYGPVQLAPGPSGWADLREEQRHAVLGDNNAELITAIDIGERTDIHPANKLEVGRRLALAAQGIGLPAPEKAVRVGRNVRVSFANAEGGLVAWSGPGPLAFEICGAEQESCRYASARIDGSSVILQGDGKPVMRVRHGWADSPVVNAYDRRNLPLPGFELQVSR